MTDMLCNYEGSRSCATYDELTDVGLVTDNGTPATKHPCKQTPLNRDNPILQNCRLLTGSLIAPQSDVSVSQTSLKHLNVDNK